MTFRVTAWSFQGQFVSDLAADDPYVVRIRGQLKRVVVKTDLGIGVRKEGKVRDRYILEDEVVLVTTDRVSAFDRVLAAVPYKGQVLNLTSLWWFEKTKHIVPNHVLRSPNAYTTVGRKCTIFPIEFVVRGYGPSIGWLTGSFDSYLTGTTDTSIWTHYSKGARVYCGIKLPDGLQKNQILDRPIVTPTTKVAHDELISAAEIVAQGRIFAPADWDYCQAKALELFAFGQQVAREHGLILVDTKYEFGKTKDGGVVLADEVHTPDSSRYWLAASYDECLRQGRAPLSVDKDVLRAWYRERCDPYKDTVLPQAPDELLVLLSRRYIQLYELITGQKFPFAEPVLSL